MKILLRRHIAAGDVFLLSVCIKALKRRFVDCTIDVATDMIETLQYNPYIEKFYPSTYSEISSYDKVFNLIDAYEVNPCTQIATCYLNVCEIFDETDTVGDLW